MKTNLIPRWALPIGLTLAFCASIVQANTPSRTVDFSGNWNLDLGQTKNLPPGLQGYSMEVRQDGRQLRVETSLKGNLQEADNSRPYPSSGGGYPGGGSPGGTYPGGRRGGTGGGMGRIGFPMPGGGMGMPGGGMGIPGGGGGRGGRSRPDYRPEGTPAAYQLYPPSATYNLDGSQSEMQFGDHNSTEADAKAEWGKGGELKFTLTGKEDSGQRSNRIEVKDQWKLSDDGQTLKVDRSVHSPEGSGTVHLVFQKQAARSSKTDGPAE